ncbi:Hpt domain-containing protein [Nitrospira sp. Nam80]
MTHANTSDSHEALIVYIDPDLEEIVPGFLNNRRKDVKILDGCIEKEQWDTIRLLGHRMKGDGGGYGFETISAIGHDLEQAALRRDLLTIRERTLHLTQFLSRVRVVYRR